MTPRWALAAFLRASQQGKGTTAAAAAVCDCGRRREQGYRRRHGSLRLDKDRRGTRLIAAGNDGDGLGGCVQRGGRSRRIHLVLAATAAVAEGHQLFGDGGVGGGVVAAEGGGLG